MTTKTEHPILFRAEMVRAILEGRKTQTRRILNPQPVIFKDHIEWQCKKAWYTTRNVNWNPITNAFEDAIECGGCPYGIPGHTLWVKENFYVQPDIWKHARTGQPIHYAATTKPEEVEDYVQKPSIFMPRWASRLTTTIESIRVERVQDITEADAIAEGIRSFTKDGNLKKYWPCDPCEGEIKCAWADLPRSPVKAFEILWDTMRAGTEYAWDKNPFVWVISFHKK